jgi:hypothetical protein
MACFTPPIDNVILYHSINILLLVISGWLRGRNERSNSCIICWCSVRIRLNLRCGWPPNLRPQIEYCFDISNCDTFCIAIVVNLTLRMTYVGQIDPIIIKCGLIKNLASGILVDDLYIYILPNNQNKLKLSES